MNFLYLIYSFLSLLNVYEAQYCRLFIKKSLKNTRIATKIGKIERQENVNSCTALCMNESECAVFLYDEMTLECSLVKELMPGSSTILAFVREGNLNDIYRKRQDCEDIYKGDNSFRSGLFTIFPNKVDRMKVYCDFDTPNQYWTVIQRRLNGQQKFDKSWEEYKIGFGDLSGEFWLGNDNIGRLTTAFYKKYKGGRFLKMRIDLWDVNDDHRYAIYGEVLFGNAEIQRYLISASEYNGTAGNSMSSNMMLFSTFDRDNTGCSQKRGNGGWWYENGRSCETSLNGEYVPPGEENEKGIIWSAWKKQSLKRVTIKIG